jgi:hypothetical protein
MERFTDALPVRLVDSRAAADPLRLAVAAYLPRYTGSSRDHARSDLRCFLSWCAERGLDPLAASRAQLELYIRWMQEVRRFKPSTVSRRFSVTGGFYRTAVIDGVLNHSSAERLSYRDFGRAVRRLAEDSALRQWPRGWHLTDHHMPFRHRRFEAVAVRDVPCL